MSKQGNGAAARRSGHADPEGSGGSGGEGGGDGIEARLAVLEARVEYLATKEDVAEVKSRVEFLAAHVQSLATKADIETT